MKEKYCTFTNKKSIFQFLIKKKKAF